MIGSRRQFSGAARPAVVYDSLVGQRAAAGKGPRVRRKGAGRMTFRAKLFILFSLTVLAGSGLLAWGATRYARSEFARIDRERNDTLAAQYQRELAQRGGEVSSAVQGLADAESTLRMALDLSRAQADPSVYANDARGLATAHQLDFLDLLGDDGSLISSA